MLAHVLAQETFEDRGRIASLLEGEQIPGSFGDLIKRSIGKIEKHEAFEGANVVSLIGRNLGR